MSKNYTGSAFSENECRRDNLVRAVFSASEKTHSNRHSISRLIIMLFATCWQAVYNLFAVASRGCWHFLACVKKNVNNRSNCEQVMNGLSIGCEQHHKKDTKTEKGMSGLFPDSFVGALIIARNFIEGRLRVSARSAWGLFFCLFSVFSGYAAITVVTPDGDTVYVGDSITINSNNIGSGAVITNICGVCTNCVYTTPEDCSNIQLLVTLTVEDNFRLINDLIDISTQVVDNISNLIHDSTTMVINSSFSPFEQTQRVPSTNYFGIIYGSDVQNFNASDNHLQQNIYNDILSQLRLDESTNNVGAKQARPALEYFIIHNGTLDGYDVVLPLEGRQYLNNALHTLFITAPLASSNLVHHNFIENRYTIPTNYNGFYDKELQPSSTNILGLMDSLNEYIFSLQMYNDAIGFMVTNDLNCSTCDKGGDCPTCSNTNNTSSSTCPTCEQMNIITQSLDIIKQDLENIQFPQTNILPAIYKLLAQYTKPVSIDVFTEDWEKIYSGAVSPLSQSWEYMPTNQLQRIELLLWSLTSLNSPSNITELTDDQLMSIQTTYSNDWNSATMSASNRIIKTYNQTSNLVQSFSTAFSELKVSSSLDDVVYSSGFDLNIASVPTLHIPDIVIKQDNLKPLRFVRSIAEAFWLFGMVGLFIVFWQVWILKLLRIAWRIMVRAFAILNQYLDL